MSLSRIWVVATNVFKEVIRDRVLYLVGLYAILMFAAAALLPSVAANAQDKIILDIGLAGIHLLGLVVTVFVGTGLINKEIEKRTVLVLISKPVSRLEFILGKHLGLSAVLAVLLGGLTAIYFGILAVSLYTKHSTKDAYELGNFQQYLGQHPVKLYTTSWCLFCNKALEYFEEKNIQFENVDIEFSEEALSQFQELNGSTIPLIISKDMKFSGFNRELLENTLIPSLH